MNSEERKLQEAKFEVKNKHLRIKPWISVICTLKLFKNSKKNVNYKFIYLFQILSSEASYLKSLNILTSHFLTNLASKFNNLASKFNNLASKFNNLAKENWFQCVRRVYKTAINFSLHYTLERDCLCNFKRLSIYRLMGILE